MAGFEQDGEHLAPQLLGGDRLVQGDFPLFCQFFVVLVAFPEGVAVQVMQIAHIAGGEQRPVAIFSHAFNE